MAAALFQLITVAAALGMIVLGVRTRARIRGFNERAVPVDAVVTGSRATRVQHSSTMTTVHFIELRFTTREGREVVVSGPGERTPPTLGSVRRLLYDPQTPTEVSFHGPRGQLRLPEVLIGLGVLLVVAMVAMRIAMLLWG